MKLTLYFLLKRKSGVKSEDSGGSNGCRNDNSSGKLQPVIKPCRDKKLDIDVQLPQGSSLITVSGIDLPPKDVGHVLQFLEFCAAFGMVCKIVWDYVFLVYIVIKET